MAMAEGATAAVRRLAALLLIAAALLGASVCAQDLPPESRIERFTHHGDGCPPGTLVGDISVDGQVLTLKFSQFGVATDQTLVGKRKQCSLSIHVNTPAGYKYRLDTVTLRGYAYLEPKVKGYHKVSYWFQGEPGTSSFFMEKEGEYDDNYEMSGVFDKELYSPCGQKRNINLKMEVRVNNDANPTGQGLLDVDTSDNQIHFKETEVKYQCKFLACETD